MYMENHAKQPLPTLEEVLVCTPATTAEEVMNITDELEFDIIHILNHS